MSTYDGPRLLMQARSVLGKPIVHDERDCQLYALRLERRVRELEYGLGEICEDLDELLSSRTDLDRDLRELLDEFRAAAQAMGRRAVLPPSVGL